MANEAREQEAKQEAKLVLRWPKKRQPKVRFASDEVLAYQYNNPIEPGPIYEQRTWCRRLVVENEEDPDPSWGESWEEAYEFKPKVKPEAVDEPVKYKPKWISKWQLSDGHS